MTKLSKKGSTPKGKNLLLKEQILPFMSRPPLRRGTKMDKDENNRVAPPNSPSVHLKGND